MPQELHVLRCYSCHMFQVHIVKKSIKWSCKICGEKQSLTKVYGRGIGKDCRIIVQKLNELHRCQELQDANLEKKMSLESSITTEACASNSKQTSTAGESKWSQFTKALSEFEEKNVESKVPSAANVFEENNTDLDSVLDF